MKLAKFFIATSANAAVTRRETSENDCIKTANGCMPRSTTLGELPPTILALLAGSSGDSALPLLAATGALGNTDNSALPLLAATGALGDNSDNALPLLAATGALGNTENSALPLLAATGNLGDNALPLLAATGGLNGENAAATIALAGDDAMKAALPAAIMSQTAQNNGDITEGLVTATLLGADDMEANLNTAAIAAQAGTPDNGLATAALLSSNTGLGNLAPLAFMGNGINTDALLTAQALGGTGDKNNLGLLLATQQNSNPVLTAAALSGNKIDPALFFASQSDDPRAAGIALATASDSTSPEFAAIVGGASPAKVLAATGKIPTENLELVALNEAGANPFNYHLMKSQPGVGSAEALLANKVNDPLATFALTKSPVLSMMTAASNGQGVNSLLPALMLNKNGNTGSNGISDASLALMAGTSGNVNPAALLLAANADNSEAGKIMQIAIQGQAGNINPMQAAYISQKPVTEVTDALIAAGIKDPATSFHASNSDVNAIRLREGPQYITSNPGLADMAVNNAAADGKPFMGLFNTGSPAGFLASKDPNPSLAWGAAATGDPLLTFAMTKNPVLSMMAGQQGNILPKEPVKVDPATGIIAGNAAPSLGFALTGDSNYLMMDKLTNPNNMDLALANAYNHPTPTQQDLFYGSLSSDPKVAYALTGNPIIANMASGATSKETLSNLAISNQINDPWTSYAILKDPKMLMASQMGGNPLVNMAAMNSDNKLMGYALTKDPNMLFYNQLFNNN